MGRIVFMERDYSFRRILWRNSALVSIKIEITCFSRWRREGRLHSRPRFATQVRTLCIDPSRPLILRDAVKTENQKTGITSITATTFIDFESDPTLSPETFRFVVPPGAVEAKAP
jgi:hypothetical protein